MTQERVTPVERTLYDRNGEPVAYIADDYQETIYLWDGQPVAYLYDDKHVYGINGRHLGWFLNDIVYDDRGARAGFTTLTCPVPVAKEPAKTRKRPMDKTQPRWTAPPLANLGFDFTSQALADLLREGQTFRFETRDPEEEPSG
jgi:hypothetical protein